MVLSLIYHAFVFDNNPVDTYFPCMEEVIVKTLYLIVPILDWL